jgi:hypothetical protein
MNARDLAALNGRMPILLKRARAAGAVGTDEELTDAILIKHGAGEIDIAALLRRLRRATARRATPARARVARGEIPGDGFT